MSSLRPFHLRILFPDLLTLSKTDPRRLNAPKSITGSKSIDLELYTYFALLLRDFIHPWYRLVTTDEDLTVEILDILTLIVQKLETRLCEQVKKKKKKERNDHYQLNQVMFRLIGQSSYYSIYRNC